MTQGGFSNGRTVPRANGHFKTDRQNAVYSGAPDWNHSQANLSLPNGGGPMRSRFPHIKDLQEKAEIEVQHIDPRLPVNITPSSGAILVQ